MLAPDTISSRYYIRSCQQDKVLVTDARQNNQEIILSQSFFISTDTIQAYPELQNLSHLDADRLKSLVTPLQVLLIATGRQQYFPSPPLYRKIKQEAWPIEFMNARAACHTFNILLNENRQVGLLFLIQ